MERLYDDVLRHMEVTHASLARRVQPPHLVPFGAEGLVFRFSDKGVHEALVQKLARIVSGLLAARLLMENGFFQEQAVLQRVLDELNEDAMFLAHGVIRGEMTDLHRQYLSAFYEEEFDNPDSALASTQKRPMIPRQRIRAYLTTAVGGAVGQHLGREALRSVHKVYSGFVHGASPHIMDMYVGDPPSWHLRGMLGTVREQEHRDDLWNVVYRSIGSFFAAGKAFGDEALSSRVLQYMRSFAAAAGQTFVHPAPESEA